jgi:hypothetical protein
MNIPRVLSICTGAYIAPRFVSFATAIMLSGCHASTGSAQTVEELKAEISKLREQINKERSDAALASLGKDTAKNDVSAITLYKLMAKRFSPVEAKAIVVARDAVERQLGHPIEAFYGTEYLKRGYRVLIDSFNGRDAKGNPRFAGAWDVVVSLDWNVIHVHPLKPGETKLSDPTATSTPER